jgi:RimJ/RimL family protein N-acetyltransferase/mannose-6-phosphate isomerase-like protein (cupin superfamily)
MIERVNLKQRANSVTELFSYLKVGQLNNQMLNVLQAENRTLDFHVHEESDEMFYCIEGEFDIESADGIMHLCEGDFIVVPKGVSHRPICKGLVKCLLIEKDGTLTNENTGGTYNNSKELTDNTDRICASDLRVHLRDWEPDDAPDVVAAINNKKVLDNLRDGVPYPYSEQDAVEFITAMQNASSDSQCAFAIIYDGKAIGSIGVFRRDNVHRFTGELGYYIAEPYWGKGIMTEAVRQICDYVFTNTDIVRIFAEPYAYNNASCRVLEKAGFQFEGILRQNAVKNGHLVDMKMYSILKPPN